MSRPFFNAARKEAVRRFDNACIRTDADGRISLSVTQYREVMKTYFAEGFEAASEQWAELEPQAAAASSSAPDQHSISGEKR